MFQSMSMTLSDIQAQLSMMQQQYNDQLKSLQESIKAIQEKQQVKVDVTSHKSRKSPRGLSVSKHSILTDFEKYIYRLVSAMSMPLFQNESSIELMKGNYKPKNKHYDVYSSCIH